VNRAVSAEAPAHPGFIEATKVWASIGLLGFGGPAGQIALMHRVLVEERRWISESRFLHALNYCMLLPGPEAQQLATYVGWLLHGTRGGVVAGTLFVLPGFLVILVLSIAYALFQETSWLESLFFGLKAAVLAVVIEAVIRVGRRALKNSLSLGLAAAAFVALFAFDVPFPAVILAAGLIGYLGARARPDLFSANGARQGITAPELPSVIGDSYVEPRSAPGRSLRVLAAWGALWLAPLLVIVPLFAAAPTPSSPTLRNRRSRPTPGCSRAKCSMAWPSPRRRPAHWSSSLPMSVSSQRSARRWDSIRSSPASSGPPSPRG
jgi:chromate transporter